MKQILITSIKAVLLQTNSNVIAPQKLCYYLPKAVSLGNMPYTFELQRLPSHDEVSKEMIRKNPVIHHEQRGYHLKTLSLIQLIFHLNELKS
jgi:hypothetical protein